VTWFLRAALPLRITARHQESQPATQNYSTQKSHHQGSKIAIKKDQPPPKPNTQARSMASGAPDVQYFVEKIPPSCLASPGHGFLPILGGKFLVARGVHPEQNKILRTSSPVGKASYIFMFVFAPKIAPGSDDPVLARGRHYRVQFQVQNHGYKK